MPNIDLSILNQRQTPAFYADVFANRPAAGFVGRIFVSTDTYAFYRDNGTSWDLIGGPGTGTVTGTGANGQVTFWNGASTITGSNDLFWDATNGHFGVNTNAPGTALDVHHDQPTVAILNQTVATNDVRIGFQNNGVGLWRIGAFYNAGANDFGIYDAVAAIQPVTIKKTTGQVLIGTSTVGSGKLVVASDTSDNGIQIVGASAPSLRIDNAESGPTKRAGFGISTATNNFIQGSADRDFCMFNGSTTASPILFGIYGTTNVQEAARISSTRNLLVGTTTDNGNKLNVNGRGYINDRLTIDGTGTGQYIQFYNSGNDRAHIYWDQSLNSLTLGTYIAGGSIIFETSNNVDAIFINSSGNLGLGVQPSAWGNTFTKNVLQFGGPTAGVGTLWVNSFNNGTFLGNNVYDDGAGNNKYILNGTASYYVQASGQHFWSIAPSGTAGNNATFTQAMTLAATGNLLIGTTTDNGSKLQVQGNATFTTNSNSVVDFLNLYNNSSTSAGGRITFGNGFGYIGAVQVKQIDNGSLSDDGILEFQTASNSVLSTKMSIKNNGQINIASIATSSAGLVSGDIWSNAGVLTIVP